jgi:hypothetical protein
MLPPALIIMLPDTPSVTQEAKVIDNWVPNAVTQD